MAKVEKLSERAERNGGKRRGKSDETERETRKFFFPKKKMGQEGGLMLCIRRWCGREGGYRGSVTQHLLRERGAWILIARQRIDPVNLSLSVRLIDMHRESEKQAAKETENETLDDDRYTAGEARQSGSKENPHPK